MRRKKIFRLLAVLLSVFMAVTMCIPTYSFAKDEKTTLDGTAVAAEPLTREEYDARGGDITEQEGVLRKADELARKCLDLGCGAVLIKCGLSGMVYRTGCMERIKQIGARLKLNADDWADRAGEQYCFKAEIVRCATGAGDVSIAAYLTALMNGETPANCAKLAAAEGAASVSSYDALGGILSLEELKKRIAEYEG